MPGRKCPTNLKNKDLKEMTEVFGNKDIANAVWSANRGQPLYLTPEGLDSDLFKEFLSLTKGNRRQALIMKANILRKSFLTEYGDWLYPSEEVAANLDENGEPTLESLPALYVQVPLDPNQTPEIPLDERMAYTLSFNKLFFDLLLNDVNEDGELIPKEDTAKAIFNATDAATDAMDSIYGKMQRYYIEANEDSDAGYLSKNFMFFKKEHRVLLRQYGISVSDTFGEEDMVSDTYSFRESNQTDLMTILPQETKLLLAGLTANEDHVNKVSRKFNKEALLDFQKMSNLLFNSLGKRSGIHNMMTQIAELTYDYPELKVLLERLHLDQNGEFLPGSTKYQKTLRNQFYRTFSNNKNKPIIVSLDNEGMYSFIDATENVKMEVLKASWLINMREIMGKDKTKSDLIVNDGYGNPIVHKKRLSTVLDLLFNEDISADERFDMAKLILTKMGVTLHPTQGYEDDVVTTSSPILLYLDFLRDQIASHTGPLSINDMFNQEVIKVQKEVQALLDYSIELMHNDSNLMYFNQDGNMEWIVTLNNGLSTFVNAYNSIEESTPIPEVVKHLLPYSKANPNGNLYSGNSIFAEHILNGEKMELAIIKGLKNNSGNGTEIQATKFGDYKAVILNSLLRGYVPALRMADRKLEYAIKNMTYTTMPEEDNLPERFVENSMGYIKDELATSFARILSPKDFGGNLLYYKDNVKKLRTFNFIYDQALNKKNKYATPETIEEFLAGKKGKTLKKFSTLADEFIENNKEYLQASFKLWFDHSVNKNVASFKKSGIFANSTKNSYLALGVDTSMLDKLKTVNSKNGIYSAKEVKQIVAIATYQHSIGTQEQLRLVYGDIAMYKDQVDFHKRTTGAGSSKYDLENSNETIALMNELMPRFNTDTQHKNTFNKAIYDDVYVQNSSLSKISPLYNNVNSSDAQSGALLDMYRSTMDRHGDWNDSHEKIYQYEMQNMVFKVLASEEYSKAASWITTDVFIDGVFAEHTGGKVPTVPMFKGKPITLEDRKGSLPILKPMGYGNIANVANLNAVSYFKTSMAPLFPSELHGDMFLKYLDWLTNDVDVVTFASAEKGTMEVNAEGNLNNWDYTPEVVSEMNFSHFGIQLDVHEKTSGKVTKSTQRNRLEFLNLYDNGKLKKGEKAELEQLRNDYYGINNDNIVEDRNALLKDFGLIEEEEAFILPKENTAKFIDKLEELFIMKHTPTNAIEGIKYALEQDIQVFDTFNYKQKIEEILMSTLKNDVIKRTTKGDLLIQESNVFFDNTLKFYTKGQPMEVMVSLPRELEQFVEDLGGLDYFNDLIATHNTEILGEEFFEILKFSANRIPSQALASLEAVKVVKFLNAYGGPRIVLPAEITVKSGSDFDVDKLTSYFKNFIIEKGKVILNNKGRAQKENKLNEIAFNTLLEPSRFEELLKPNSSKSLEELAIKVAKKQGDTTAVPKTGTENVISLDYNLDKSYQFWTSKANVALAAVQNSAHAFSQQAPSNLTLKEFNIFFSGQEKEEGDFYRDGFVYDNKGNTVSDTFAEFLTAFVDAVKNPFVFRLNIIAEVFNAYTFLHRFGVADGSTDIKTLVSFFTQPVILNYLQNLEANTNMFNYKNQYDKETYKGKGKIALIEDTLKELSRNATGSIKKMRKYKETTAYHLQRLTVTVDSSAKMAAIRNKHKNMLQDLTEKYGYKHFSKVKLDGTLSANDEMQVFDNFLSYVAMGKFMGIQQKVTRPDAIQSVESDMFSSERKAALWEWLNGNGIISSESLYNQIAGENSLIRESYNVQASSMEMFGNFFYTKKDEVVLKFFEKNIVDRLLGPNSELSDNDKAKITKKFENDFFNFLYALKFRQAPSEKYIETFQGDKSVARRLIKAKKANPHSYFLEELSSLIDQYVPRQGRNSEIDNISTFGKRFTMDESNLLTSSADDLRRSESKKERKLYKDIADLSMLQSGFNNSPIAFNTLLPNSEFVPRMAEVIEQFSNREDSDKENLLGVYLEQFFRNSWNDTKIIPRSFGIIYNSKLETLKEGDRYDALRKKDSFNKEKWVTVAYYPLGRNANKTLAREGKKIPVEVALFRNIYDAKAQEYSGLFELVGKLGDGFKFKEFYPLINAHEPSILKANNYDLAYIKNSITTNKNSKANDKFKPISEMNEDYSSEWSDYDNTPTDYADQENTQYNPNDSEDSAQDFRNKKDKWVPVDEANNTDTTIPTKKVVLDKLKINLPKENVKELRKEISSGYNTDLYEAFVEQFDELFPKYKNKFNSMEKDSYAKAIAKGKVKIVCGL